MTTRICIRLNNQEQAAFAKIKGRLNDAEGFRVMMEATKVYANICPESFRTMKRYLCIKTSTRNGRHIGKKKPANY